MNQNPIFTITGRSGAARTGILQTAHGAVRTPVFMPVGTQGSVKSLDADDLASLGAEIILGNTYHLHLRPGDELIARQGGLHRFMAWDRSILTDSGGFQVFSLSGLRKITPDGVAFASHIDGSRRFFSPEKVIEIQKNLGSDVVMVLDECPPPDAGRDYTEKSLALTTDWAARCRAAMPAGSSGQLLFGIVQGGFFADLRARSAAEICSLGFEGHAIGGLSVGEDRALTYEMLAATAPLLPEDKPRYLMGVGAPADLLEGVSQGIDMFDCVLATRNARNGTLYTFSGKINIKGAAYAEDPGPIDPECSCLTCRTYSRAYLRHLYMARELSSYRLNTIHNLAFFAELMRRTRAAIATGDLPALKRRVFELYPPEPPAAPRSGPDK